MILGILGSASPDSVTRKGLLLFARVARERGHSFDLLDLATETRFLQDISEYDEPGVDTQTRRLRDRVTAASAVVLATPVHHGSYSGLLKNALDHLEGDAFDFKPVGLLAAAGNPRSAAVACEHLRSVVRAMSGWSAPTHVALGAIDFETDAGLELLQERSTELADELARFVRHAAIDDGGREGLR